MDLSPKSLEVIVDVHCAAAILRGANIFAPGVIGMQQGDVMYTVLSFHTECS